MLKTTTCYVCGEITKPKEWINFMDFCKHCQMKWNVEFEMQFQKHLVKKPVLKLENR
jgi:hypothetical protein